MISVEEAAARIVAALKPVESERVEIAALAGRVLAEDARARFDQPPFPASAMDGYALRAADGDAPRRIVGLSEAGHPFAGALGTGEAVRIFTGAVVPDGADAIAIQEDAEAADGTVRFRAPPAAGRHIRSRGFDFRAGDVLARAGQRLTARDCALLAAGDVASAPVRRRPRIAVAATGDELSRPGAPRKPGGIAASSVYGLIPLVAQWGGEPVDLGILPDDKAAIATLAEVKADLIVTLGGASVGERDLVQAALGPHGFTPDFWKVAMRPGKPLIFGHLKQTPLLGLPGNPVSTFVCAILFLAPAIAALLGTPHEARTIDAKLALPLPAGDARQSYLRAALAWRDGAWWARIFPAQDSAMLSTFAAADGLVLRPPHAPAAGAGERVTVLPLP